MLGGDAAALVRLARASDVLVASRDDALAVFGGADPVELLAAELVLTDGGRAGTVTTAAGCARQPIPAALALAD